MFLLLFLLPGGKGGREEKEETTNNKNKRVNKHTSGVSTHILLQPRSLWTRQYFAYSKLKTLREPTAISPLSILPSPTTMQNEKEQQVVMLGPEGDPDAEPKFDTCHTRPAAPSAAAGAKLCRRRRRGRSAQQSKVAARPGVEVAGTGWGAEVQRARVRTKKLTATWDAWATSREVAPAAPRQKPPNNTPTSESRQLLPRVGGAPWAGRGGGGSRSQQTRPPHK